MSYNGALIDVIRRIRSKYNVVAVVLFGSRARGDWGPWSDYDLLVIAEFRSSYLDRLREITQLVSDIPLPLEFHAYTLEEAIELLKKGSPTIVDALEEGIILYASNRFSVLKDIYKELKKRGLKRTSVSIVVPDTG